MNDKINYYTIGVNFVSCNGLCTMVCAIELKALPCTSCANNPKYNIGIMRVKNIWFVQLVNPFLAQVVLRANNPKENALCCNGHLSGLARESSLMKVISDRLSNRPVGS